MKERFPIFIDRESIYTIADMDSRNFDCLFNQRAEIYLNMTEKEIEDMESCLDHTNQNALGLYFSKLDVTPLSGKSQFEEFYSFKANLSELFSGCIFILDIASEKAKSLSNELGVWILSKDDIDRDAECLVLNGVSMEDEDVIPQKEYVCLNKNGWTGLFEGREKLFPPYNEIIIYDNFIKEFARKYLETPPYKRKIVSGKRLPYTYIGLENLLSLFSAILPMQHRSSIKILIVLPKYIREDFEERLEQRIKIWIEEVKHLRSYNIIVSCLLIGNPNWQNEDKELHPLHPRILYTNYFSIKTEKGFKIFEPEPYSTIVRKDGDSKNSVSISSFFSKPQMRSNPLIANYNNKLKDLGEQLVASSPEKKAFHDNLIIGDAITLESFSLFEDLVFDR